MCMQATNTRTQSRSCRRAGAWQGRAMRRGACMWSKRQPACGRSAACKRTQRGIRMGEPRQQPAWHGQAAGDREGAGAETDIKPCTRPQTLRGGGRQRGEAAGGKRVRAGKGVRSKSCSGGACPYPSPCPATCAAEPPLQPCQPEWSGDGRCRMDCTRLHMRCRAPAGGDIVNLACTGRRADGGMQAAILERPAGASMVHVARAGARRG